MSEMKLIGTLRKNSRETFHLTVGTLNGVRMASVRLMKVMPDGRLRPLPVGLYVKADQIADIAALWRRAAEYFAGEMSESPDER